MLSIPRLCAVGPYSSEHSVPLVGKGEWGEAFLLHGNESLPLPPPKKIYPKMDIVKSENPTWFSAAKRILMGSPAPPKHGWLPFCFQPTSLRPKKHNSKESINIMLSSATAAGLAHPPADSSTAGQALPTAPFPSTL